MSPFQAALLGVVQGLTEFLPVSSSGHLVLMQNFLGLSEPQLLLDTLLHFATLMAVVVFFRRDLLRLNLSQLISIGIASVPAGLVGIFLADQIEQLFSSLLIVGGALMVTGVLNLVADRVLSHPFEETAQEVKPAKAVVIGLAQAIAIIPGISRSGSTVFAGIMQKIDRQVAFRFSFIMSIPVILGATLLQVKDVIELGSYDVTLITALAGIIAAFATGLASLKLFAYIMKKAHLEIFGWYCLAVGAITFVTTLL